MSRVKIQLADNIKRVVTLDTEATRGAQLGLDLRLPSGAVATPTTFLQWLGTTAAGSASGGSSGPSLQSILTTKGDLATRDTQVQRLGIGSEDQALRVSAAGMPEWRSGAALTKTNDTNVTLTLGGTPATALLEAASLTLGWTGELAATRGGTGFGSYTAGDLLYADSGTTLAKLAAGSPGYTLRASGAGLPEWRAPRSLTKTDDTNVTLTLGGTPTDALLADTSLTLGWTGTLAQDRGGWGADVSAAAGYAKFTAGVAAFSATIPYSDISGTPAIPPDLSALTFLTESDETGTAANSRQLLPGTNVTFDTTTPGELTINAMGGGGTVESVVGTTDEIDVDATDPANPVVALAAPVIASLELADDALQPADIGTSVQAWSANLDDWSAMAPSAKQDASAALSAYAGGDTPSAFTLGIVDSADAAAWRAAIGAGTSSLALANPGATYGVNMTGANGSAVTALRSDAVLKIDPAIAPTWTGTHTFSKDRTAANEYALVAIGSNCAWSLRDSASAVDNRRWYFQAAAGQLVIGAINDADNSARDVWRVSRSGISVTTIALGNATDSTAVTAYGTITGVGGTWSGTHVFRGSASRAVATGQVSLGMIGGLPAVDWAEAAAAANQKLWEAYSTGGTWTLQATNDALTVGRNALAFSRSGVAVAGMVYGNSTDNPPHTFNGAVRLSAATTARESLRIPHGTAPSAPVDGDMWTTTAGLYVRINGVTVGPLS